ncbi:restriction endonuclease subunit S [Phormidium sp. FACHB-1136]|nr:restriction endonuclease subunit S [Phormidium sp. FACHB-1136]
MPPKEEIEVIAHILGSLDDKIELNQQMNQTLEGIARALFKSWFIDFDPVRAKLDGRQPYGMDAETAALFPNSFEDSPLGKIPKGWEIQPLDKIANFLNGLALQKYPPEDENFIPVIKIAEMRKGITENSGKASPNIDGQYIIADGEILFSWSGSLEVVIWCDGIGALNQHLFKVTSNKYPKWFFYHWVKSHLANFQAIAASKATTMGHIQRRHLTEALTVVAPQQILEVADKEMSPLLDRLIANKLENRTLSSIRDFLLPKLLSGEICVKDAEETVAEVA